jgi:membrane-anchored protein YejM (alkaline phosphatase superfamily)
LQKLQIKLNAQSLQADPYSYIFVNNNLEISDYYACKVSTCIQFEGMFYGLSPYALHILTSDAWVIVTTKPPLQLSHSL